MAKKYCCPRRCGAEGSCKPSAAGRGGSPGAAYLHPTKPSPAGFPGAETGVPLVADFSSTILAADRCTLSGRSMAGQKNMGPPGLAVVIVRDDLLGRARSHVPAVLDWTAMAADGSMYNTPASFSWYVAGLVFQWLKRQGGLAAMAKLNRTKAERLYAAIDESSLYRNPVDPACRSWMNVTFTLVRPELNADFLEGAKGAGLMGLAGHRSIGGMRASIYNAMTLAGVEALIGYMQEFERRHG
jgi:phosphoserine aminotransferase